jgi:hypothetical protein
MNARPLWVVALLVLLYWEAPRIVSRSKTFARRSIIFVAPLLLPYMLYAVVYRIPHWPNQTTTETVLSVLGFIGMFAGVCCAAISLVLDAKRQP